MKVVRPLLVNVQFSITEMFLEVIRMLHKCNAVVLSMENENGALDLWHVLFENIRVFEICIQELIPEELEVGPVDFLHVLPCRRAPIPNGANSIESLFLTLCDVATGTARDNFLNFFCISCSHDQGNSSPITKPNNGVLTDIQVLGMGKRL